jgi:hypothetical protein
MSSTAAIQASFSRGIGMTGLLGLVTFQWAAILVAALIVVAAVETQLTLPAAVVGAEGTVRAAQFAPPPGRLLPLI